MRWDCDKLTLAGRSWRFIIARSEYQTSESGKKESWDEFRTILENIVKFAHIHDFVFADISTLKWCEITALKSRRLSLPPWARLYANALEREKNAEKKSVFPLVLALTHASHRLLPIADFSLANSLIALSKCFTSQMTLKHFVHLANFLFLCHFYGRECENFPDHTIFRIIGNGGDKRVSRLKIAHVYARARQKTIAKAISRYLELIMRSSRKIYCGRQKLARCFFYSLKKSRLTPAINSLLFFLIRKRFLYFALL